MPPEGSKATASLLRHLNARGVVAALQHHGPLSRTDIARHTGISHPTITRTVSDLLEARILEEGERHQPAMGRPSKVLRLATKSVSVLGLVVGVQTCELVSAGLDGSIHPGSSRVFMTPRRYGDLVRVIAAHVDDFASRTGTSLLGLGVSMPGLLSRRDERTLVSPNLPQTDGQQLGLDVSEQTGLDVAIQQEMQALCLAERTYGAARGTADFALLDVTGGLGLGVVQGGQFIVGHSGLAGELGHITVDLAGRDCGCGNRGCLETVATDAALCTLVGERLGPDYLPEVLFPLLARREIKADQELALVLDYLSVGLAAVINLFNPEKLLVFGRMFDIGSDVFPRLLELTAKRTLAPSLADCTIIRAQSNKQLGAIAGIIHRLTSTREA